MLAFTASDAKNRFGELLDAAGNEPVTIQRNGRDVAVILSAAEFARLSAEGGRGGSALVRAMHEESIRDHEEVYEALAK